MGKSFPKFTITMRHLDFSNCLWKPFVTCLACNDTLISPKKRKNDPSECVSAKIGESGCNGFPPLVRDDLKKTLESEPRETSHCAAITEDDSRRHCCSGELSLFHFWLKHLELHGTEQDKQFLQQAKEKNFCPTHNREKAVKMKPTHADTSPQIKPSVSHSSAIKFWKQFYIRFEARKCDICETCFRLRCACTSKDNTPEQKEKRAQALFDHQNSAALHIFIRKQWNRASVTSFFRREHWQVDFAANPRCPHMDLGQDFYSRMLGISVFIIVSSLCDETCVFLMNKLPKGVR